MKRAQSTPISRRTAIKTTAGLLGVAGTGLGAIALTSGDAEATVTVTSWTVEDTSATLAPGEAVDDVRAIANVEFDYDSSHPLDERTLRLSAANSTGEYYTLTERTVGGPPQTDDGTERLSGSLLTTPAFDASNFQAAEGQTFAVEVMLKVELLLYRSGEQVALADSEGVGRVTVSKESLTVSAQTGGSGGFDVSVGTETPTDG